MLLTQRNRLVLSKLRASLGLHGAQKESARLVLDFYALGADAMG